MAGVSDIWSRGVLINNEYITNWDEVGRLIELHEVDISHCNPQDSSRRNLLHYAIEDGGKLYGHLRSRIFGLLFDNMGEEAINATDESGRTPLHWAVLYGKTDVVRRLCECGADVNATDERDTALHLALKRGNAEMAKILLDNGADPNIQDGLGKTPLHIAVEKRFEDVVLALLSKEADCQLSDHNGKKAIDLAVELKHDGIKMHLMFAESTTDFDSSDSTPSMLRRFSSHEELAVRADCSVPAGPLVPSAAALDRFNGASGACQTGADQVLACGDGDVELEERSISSSPA